jgi:nucleoid DNA-binding protein
LATTKADLARAVYERHGGISTRQAAELVDLVLEILKSNLVMGRRLALGEFGAMETLVRRDRRGRRPGGGRPVSRCTLRYYPPPALRGVEDAPAEVRYHTARQGGLGAGGS